MHKTEKWGLSTPKGSAGTLSLMEKNTVSSNISSNNRKNIY